MGPKGAERFPCADGGVGFKRAHHAVGVGRIQVALEEAVLQTVGASRKAELLVACRLFHSGRPCDQLVIGQRVDVSAFGQEFQCLFVSGHDVGRLHPRQIMLLIRAQLAQFQERRVHSHAAQIKAGQIRQIGRIHRSKAAVQIAQHTNRAVAGLQFSVQTCQERTAIVGLIVGTCVKAGQDLIAHRLRFLDRFGLRGPEQHFGLRGTGGQRDGSRCTQ